MHKMHKKKELQKKRKFVGLEWHAALSAMRTWIAGHPDTRMNSRIRVSADPPDRQMPVSAACVSSLKILCFLCLFVANYPESALIGVNLRFLSLLCLSAWFITFSRFLAPWRFNSSVVPLKLRQLASLSQMRGAKDEAV